LEHDTRSKHSQERGPLRAAKRLICADRPHAICGPRFPRYLCLSSGAELTPASVNPGTPSARTQSRPPNRYVYAVRHSTVMHRMRVWTPRFPRPSETLITNGHRCINHRLPPFSTSLARARLAPARSVSAHQSALLRLSLCLPFLCRARAAGSNPPSQPSAPSCHALAVTRAWLARPVCTLVPPVCSPPYCLELPFSARTCEACSQPSTLCSRPSPSLFIQRFPALPLGDLQPSDLLQVTA